MRPIKGQVVGRDTILMENGVTVTTTIPKGIKWYDAVLVCYDFTTNTVAGIRPIGQGEPGDESHEFVEPTEEELLDGETDDTGGWHEFTGGSGALL